MPVSWLTEITAWEPPHRFVDEQLTGPVRAVAPHAHLRADGEAARSCATSCATGSASARSALLANRLLVRRDVEAIFDFRAERIAALLAAA